MGAIAMTRGAAWIDGMRGRSVLEVAADLGVMLRGPRSSSGGELACPACGAEHRHTKTSDRRLACGVRRDGLGWRCYQCDASGDALDLAAYVIGDERLRDLPDHRKADVRTWAERFLGIDAGPTSSARPRTIKRPPPAPVVEHAPSYPPAEELAAVWAACGRVDDDIATITHLGGKPRPGIAEWRVDPEGLARLLPTEGELPAWAEWWRSRGLRVVAPIFDACGELRGMRARHPSEKMERPIYERSERAPNGWNASGLVFASRIGRRLLAGDDDARGEALRHGVEIVEGFPAYLARSTRHGAGWGVVFGIFSGAWTQAHADRIPDGCRVVIDPDPDTGGEKYARDLEATFAERWRAGRLAVMHSKRWASYLAAKGRSDD